MVKQPLMQQRWQDLCVDALTVFKIEAEPVILTEKIIQKLVPRSSWPTYKNKYRFTKDDFTRAIPHWKRWLKPLRGQNIKALEIGTFEGRATFWLLENILTHPQAKIFCIDCYGPETGLAIQNFKHNLAWTDFYNKVQFFHAYSNDVVPGLPQNEFDLIYLDGNIYFDCVRKDLNMTWPLLKKGGHMIVNNYKWGRFIYETKHRPKVAIDEFLEQKIKTNELELLHKGYQVFVRKK